ncbi:MAG: type IX secretion system membrane protein PorP/SprF [Eudoraea sp.]|nr:type IX secretion system membrane protein PorP/SprF [Eudoraea sp.]
MRVRSIYIWDRLNVCQILLSACLTLLVFTGVYGQREPQYTQYMYNIGSFNPAYIGSVDKADISLLYRSQWIDIPGAPRTLRLGVNIPMKNERHGIGLNIVSDELGPSSQTYVDLGYSFQVRLSGETKLAFGLDAGGSFLNVDFSEGTFENPGEPILDAEIIKNFYATIGAGLFMYGDDWYIGTSVPNFLTDDLYNAEVATIVEDKLQFNFIGGVVFDLNENLKFKPAFLVNLISGAPATFNASANFLFSDAFTAGVSYRADNAISGLAGLKISNAVYIGYAYDYATTALADYSSGSHEVILKFYLGSGDPDSGSSKSKSKKGKGKQIDTPRFF